MEIRIIPVKIDEELDNMEDFLKTLGDKLEGILEEGDVVVIASKILLKVRGLYIQLDDVKPSDKAVKLANLYNMDPRYVELILSYSDKVLGGVDKVLLTYAGKVLTANAGLDRKNIGGGRVSLPPYLLRGVSKEIYEYLLKRLGVKVGVVITDSVVHPLRMGTRLYAVDLYGFEPIKDYRGKEDIFGRNIVFTRMNLADEISSAAHLVMGEGREKIPVAIIKGLKLSLVERDLTQEIHIDPKECLYKDLYLHKILD